MNVRSSHSGNTTRNSLPGRKSRPKEKELQFGSTRTEHKPEDIRIKVAIRVRPKLPHESRAKDCVECDSQSIALTSDRDERKQFTVDQVIDSRDGTSPMGSQEFVYNSFAREFCNQSLKGYNVCLFAFGHTGSGKTYTMMGVQNLSDEGSAPQSQAGVLPRFIWEIFHAHARDAGGAKRHYTCEFYEIYNETVKDLLLPSNVSSQQRTCKVHVHPVHGVFVQDLTKTVVNSFDDALQLMAFGNSMRATASTTMNERSSRSHAIFSFSYESIFDNGKSVKSTVTLVDLAGREDASVTKNKEQLLRELGCINLSLFHLSNVIMKLSKGELDDKGSFGDFRNSKLTLLLAPALMGNTRTALLSTVAPLQNFFDDSLSTLSFARSVKQIQTRPMINNKSSKAISAELEAEIKALQKDLANTKMDSAERESALVAAHAMIEQYKQSWEEAVKLSEELQSRRVASVQWKSMTPKNDGDTGMMPFFTKLCNDPSLQGYCNYFLEGIVLIGSDTNMCDIIIHGLGIMLQMCKVIVTDDEVEIVLVCGKGGEVPRVLVNGSPLTAAQPLAELKHGDCIVLGYAHAFRLVIPSAAVNDTGSDVPDAHELAKSLGALDVSSALTEIVDESGDQYKSLVPYISSLQTRVSEKYCASFMETIHQICPLVDEANLLTKEIFGSEQIHFEVHALTDVFNFSRDEPELVVCMLQVKQPLARFRRAVHTIIHDKMAGASQVDQQRNFVRKNTNDLTGRAMHPMVHELGLSEHMIKNNNPLIAALTLEKFLGRLKAMRELYQEGFELKDNMTGLRRMLDEQPLKNPWRVMTFAEQAAVLESHLSPKNFVDVVAQVMQRQKSDENNKSPPEKNTSPSRTSSLSVPVGRDSKSPPAAAPSYAKRASSVNRTSVEVDSLRRSIKKANDAVEEFSPGHRRHTEAATKQPVAQDEAAPDEALIKVKELLLREEAQKAVHQVFDPSLEGSEVSRWLQQVEGLRDSLQEHATRAEGADTKVAEVIQQVQAMRQDFQRIVREELSNQLQNLKLDKMDGSDVSASAGSTGIQSTTALTQNSQGSSAHNTSGSYISLPLSHTPALPYPKRTQSTNSGASTYAEAITPSHMAPSPTSKIYYPAVLPPGSTYPVTMAGAVARAPFSPALSLQRSQKSLSSEHISRSVRDLQMTGHMPSEASYQPPTFMVTTGMSQSLQQALGSPNSSMHAPAGPVTSRAGSSLHAPAGPAVTSTSRPGAEGMVSAPGTLNAPVEQRKLVTTPRQTEPLTPRYTEAQMKTDNSKASLKSEPDKAGVMMCMVPTDARSRSGSSKRRFYEVDRTASHPATMVCRKAASIAQPITVAQGPRGSPSPGRAPKRVDASPARGTSAERARVMYSVQYVNPVTRQACPNCGNVYMPDANYCRKCGAIRGTSPERDDLSRTQSVKR